MSKLEALNFDDLIGIPFQYGARPGESSNLDCYGLVVECHRRLGSALPSRQFAENKNVVAALMSVQMNDWERCERRVGAVILFRIERVLCHVGMVVDEFRFIHTWEKSGGVCLERIEDWEHRIEGYYEYKGR